MEFCKIDPRKIFSAELFGHDKTPFLSVQQRALRKRKREVDRRVIRLGEFLRLFSFGQFLSTELTQIFWLLFSAVKGLYYFWQNWFGLQFG
jgi:hypothetical protein